jgi:anti-sigma factor RsiW
MMTEDIGPTLCAYLDGELSPPDRAALEARLGADAALRAELAGLRAADAAARAGFAAMLKAPVPLSLVAGLRHAPPPRRMPPWAAIAASIALVAFGAIGGYRFHRPDTPRDWVAEVAEYHAVYAAQDNHLVEVPAARSAHIVTWLTREVGTPVRIPDLSAKGLVFQGARLLVAAGRPVGQLMYRDSAGQVVALCIIAGDDPATDGPRARSLGTFDSLVWGRDGAGYILIAPKDYRGLGDIAAVAQSA